MIARFQRRRWSNTRLRIEALSRGESATFTAPEYFNAKSSTERLNDAYADVRQWRIRCHLREATVTRTK